MTDDVQDGPPDGVPDRIAPNGLKPPESVQSMARGLAVIKAFDGTRPRMTLSEVARQTNLSRATARRFLHTLVALGYTDTDGREFWLRPKVLELGYAYLSSLSLPDVAAAHLKSLADQVNESASVSVLDGGDIVYVARVPTRRIMTVSISVGTRFPAFATSMGRVLLAALPPSQARDLLASGNLKPLTRNTTTDPELLLAELDRVRKQGWALVDQELEVGLRSIAVPVRDARGNVVAAMNVSVSATQDSVEQSRQRLLPPLLAVAGALEHDLGVKQHNGS
jgi:IclR family pca regulon transcriptional regulator